jgi:DNA polymerase-1
MHIPIIEVVGYEVMIYRYDCKQAEKENYKVFMVTPDKDFATCLRKYIHVQASSYG